LRKTLEEEKKTNEKLTELSDRINVEAAEANEIQQWY
jgi:ferritin-like metal-binding protein YciE